MKLVRDKIPHIIKAHGEQPEYSLLTPRDPEYRNALLAKLREETDEFEATPLLEELADILEVVHALADNLGYAVPELDLVRAGKRIARGGFLKGVMLK